MCKFNYKVPINRNVLVLVLHQYETIRTQARTMKERYETRITELEGDVLRAAEGGDESLVKAREAQLLAQVCASGKIRGGTPPATCVVEYRRFCNVNITYDSCHFRSRWLI